MESPSKVLIIDLPLIKRTSGGRVILNKTVRLAADRLLAGIVPMVIDPEATVWWSSTRWL